MRKHWLRHVGITFYGAKHVNHGNAKKPKLAPLVTRSAAAAAVALGHMQASNYAEQVGYV